MPKGGQITPVGVTKVPGLRLHNYIGFVK